MQILLKSYGGTFFMENNTPIQAADEVSVEETIEIVYNALLNKGHDSVSQFAGYILSEDPLYIPDWENARGLISRVDRDELLKLIIKYYFENRFADISATTIVNEKDI